MMRRMIEGEEEKKSTRTRRKRKMRRNRLKRKLKLLQAIVKNSSSLKSQSYPYVKMKT